MRKSLLIIISILLLLAAISTYLLSRNNVSQFSGTFYKITSGAQQPALVGNQLHFFTGSFFASLDINTGKAGLLSKDLSTSGQFTVTDLTNQYAIFSASGVNAYDPFGQLLTANGENLSSSHWWQYTFNTKQLTPLNFMGMDSCTSVVESGVSMYCFSPYLGSSHIFNLSSYSLPGGTATNLLRTSGPVSNVKAGGGFVYYVTTALDNTQSLNVFNMATNSSRVVYKSAGKILDYGFSSQAALVDEAAVTTYVPLGNRAYLQNTPLAQTLKLMNLDGVVLKKSSFNLLPGSITSSPSGLAFASPAGELYQASGTSIKQIVLGKQGLIYIWGSGNVLYGEDSSGSLYVTSASLLSKVPSVKNIAFSNFDGLLNYGISPAELNSLEQALFEFSPAAKSISLDASSISIVPHNSESQSLTDTAYLNVAIDGSVYKARLDYSSLTSSELYLYAPSGAQVYDSGLVYSNF